jgi:hypothetical protein
MGGATSGGMSSTAGKGGGTAGGDVGGSSGSGGKGGSAGSGVSDGGDMNAGGDGNDAGAMPGGSSGTGGSAGTGGAGGSSGKGGSAGKGGSGGSAGKGGNSLCADQFALCESFESGTLDTDIWDTQGPGTVTVETTQAARGTHSAHFHTEDNGFAYIHQTQTFPAPGNKYYARIFVYFDSMPDAPDWAHWTVAGAEDSTGAVAGEIRIGGQYNPNEDKNLFGVGTDGGDTGDWTNLDDDPSGNATEVPVHEWICLEWMFDAGNNQTQFWWDGVEHPSLATSEASHGGSSDPFVLPAFDSSWFGWWLYQTGTNPPEFDVWIDEIAIDYDRIGCDK